MVILVMVMMVAMVILVLVMVVILGDISEQKNDIAGDGTDL